MIGTFIFPLRFHRQIVGHCHFPIYRGSSQRLRLPGSDTPLHCVTIHSKNRHCYLGYLRRAMYHLQRGHYAATYGSRSQHNSHYLHISVCLLCLILYLPGHQKDSHSRQADLWRYLSEEKARINGKIFFPQLAHLSF